MEGRTFEEYLSEITRENAVRDARLGELESKDNHQDARIMGLNRSAADCSRRLTELNKRCRASEEEDEAQNRRMEDIEADVVLLDEGLAAADKQIQTNILVAQKALKRSRSAAIGERLRERVADAGIPLGEPPPVENPEPPAWERERGR